MSRRPLNRAPELAALLVVAACSSKESYSIKSGPRDWTQHPAVMSMDAPTSIYALSDIHGGYDRLASLLAANHLTPSVPSSPSAMKWMGSAAALVVTGDLIDKGAQSVETIDALMALDASAAAAGGHVIVLIGNHEAEFFVDPTNSKASAFDDELNAAGVSPGAIADGSDPRGKWLRDRAFAAKVGSWFFAHAGDTHGRSIPEIEQALENAIRANDYDDPEITGSDSILESRDWYSSDSSIGARYSAALGAAHIVFGHDPHALGPDGVISSAQGGTLFRIDCGMSPAVDYSRGVLLHIMGDTVEALDETGAVVAISGS